MKTSELINLLQKQLAETGDREVFFNSRNDDDMWAMVDVQYHVTEQGEFPRSWRMPQTFTLITG